MTPANLVVYPDGPNFVVRDLFALQTIAQGSASEVLAAALAALPPGGGMIQLAAGEFPLERPLVIGSRVMLRGAGRATRLLAPKEGAAAVVLLSADASTLADFSIVSVADAVASGVILDQAGDCSVSGVFVKGFAAHGISVRNRSFLCRLEGCVAAGCGQAGFHFHELAKDGRGGDYVPNIASGCTAYGGGTGFSVDNALVLNLVGCMVHQSRQHGFHLTRHSNSVLLSGCRTFQVGSHAVLVEDSNELNISSSIFCWSRDHGIVLRKVSWGTVSGNNVIDAGVRAPDGGRRHGIFLAAGTEGIQVTANAIFSWGDQVPMACGVNEDETCRNNNVLGNNLNFFRDGGFVMRGNASVESGNLAFGDPAYRGDLKNPFPDFTTTSIERFIASQ